MVHYKESCFLSPTLHLIYNICGELSGRFMLASFFILTPVTFAVRHTTGGDGLRVLFSAPVYSCDCHLANVCMHTYTHGP